MPGHEASRNPERSLVTVLIPARNEEGTISECLDSVLAQDHSALQIVVVDGDSLDNTRSIVDRYREQDRRIELVTNSQRTIPKALVLGLKSARGRWLIRVDAHSTIPPDYVGRALRHLESGRWGGVGGRKEAVGITVAGKAIAAVLGSPLGVGGSVYHYGTEPQTVDHIPFGAYPTRLVSEMGGWDEGLVANEDFEFDYRLRERGYQLLFDPSLRIAWQCRQSISELWKQYLRYGRGKAHVAVLHPRSLRPRHVWPPLLAVALCAAAAVRSKRMAAGVVLPYALFVLWGVAVVAPRLEDPRARAWLPLVFPSMQLAWGFGFWSGLASALHSRLASLGPDRRVVGTHRRPQ